MQTISETVPSETEDMRFDVQIPKGRYISPEKRQQIVDKPRLT